jgi:hypothetical protein
MKLLKINFHLDLELYVSDALDASWVAEQYLSSDRFSTNNFHGEPGSIVCAVSGITEKVAP